jgi:hypothetical protein
VTEFREKGCHLLENAQKAAFVLGILALLLARGYEPLKGMIESLHA